jgi:hypothetical protein
LPIAKHLIRTITKPFKKKEKPFYIIDLKRFRVDGRSGFVARDTSYPVSRMIGELFETGALPHPRP